MTLNEAVYQILEVAAPNRSDDDVIDNRFLKALIHTKRAHFITNEMNKNRIASPALLQDINCLEMEMADDAECCDFKSGCTVLRSKLEIPMPIAMHNSLGIERIGPVSASQPGYSLMPYEKAIYFGNGRYNKTGMAAYIRNNRVYVVSPQPTALIDLISVRGIFEDPSELASFTSCSGNPCYNDDASYPLDARTWDYIKEEIISKDMARILSMPQDLENDAMNFKNPAQPSRSSSLDNMVKKQVAAAAKKGTKR
tara:strand:+ start:6702 stop:7463 length:762 start_codon:yes stop_codon:yes gene_type:complete